ncbi:glutamine ABC transporter substrate-binding protein [Dysgonomonas sp. 216]|uniref:transporter substrate-binding domain-containing protein n=1 Tax=Dysgonomonas sp. 216 TaxID=2302934 RepID=UPI0013D7A6D4|nr:transporter substrate-binding domain-containing protein [Dysgonomonas sp. 216]NDW19087.1 glutamine ABC transporter substrate-binding protein [Dysgonomonas sp. 216]
MSRYKKITLISAFVIMIIVAVVAYLQTDRTKQTAHKDYHQIMESRKLRVITDYNSVGYFVMDDTVAGFNHDLLQLFAANANLELDVKLENDLQKSIDALNRGEVDILARNIPANFSLKNDVAFTQPIIRNKLVLVQHISENKDEKPIRSLLDLAKKTVYVSKASPAKLRLENLSNEIGDTIFVKEDSLYESTQLIMKVASAEIEYVVCDAAIAEKVAKIIPNIDIKTDVGFTHLEAWAVSKSSPVLLDSLNIWIGRLQQSPVFDRIYRKYYK